MHKCDDSFLVFHGLGVRHVDRHETPLSLWTDLTELSVRCTTCDAVGTRFERGFESLGVNIR